MLQRNCFGDYNTHPGRWAEVTGNCSTSYETSNITNSIHRLLGQYIVNGSWNYEELARISYRINEFTCIDLFMVSKALYYMTVEEYMYNLFDHFQRTMDNTLEAFGMLNEKCQKFNSSSYILGAVNVFFNRVTEEPNDLKQFIKNNFIFQISNPFEENITGLALYKNELDSFKNYTLKKIFKNESYSDISTENLELASYVPADLIERLSQSLSEEDKAKFKIIIVAFRNHTLFDLGDNKDVISKVIGISISGFCSHTKTNLFDIYSKPLIETQKIKIEAEWFTINNDDIYSEEIITECNFPPITYMFLYDDEKDNKKCQRDVYPYAELSVKETESTLLKFPTLYRDFDILSSLSISINYAQPQTVIESIYKRHHFVLKTIMVIGCTLSLFSLLATTLTLISIKNWYKKRMYTIQLEIAMGLKLSSS
ncbi:mitochondria associated granulocyte macrophage csf signaling molecule [Holotrichia oblita]|uniref:Mitochondria associated granulocyte macrophage csf signaling molecule n=1 Tax=Holotrichia oblita TaxID=644536 RepID=A0ACB9SIN8_HOLOL|nr:mitochondria associated granulocyte macrophage csf signaling molecule [Holotrichia oblita]